MNEAADLDAVRRCLAGEAGAFEILIRRYQGPVLNLAYRIVRDREDARDVAQSVFLKAYAGLSAFDPRYKLFSWLYRIAVNESIRFAERRDRREPEGSAWAPAPTDPADDLAADELRRRIETAMAGLVPAQRALLALSAEGLTYREMGDTLGLPERKIKSRLFEARDRLRTLLERSEGASHVG